MFDPTFSVIIPAFNAESTIRSTVLSVLNQSEPDSEIILIDDGSTDSTLREMLDLGCQDLRIRLVSEPNSGVSAARNYGASLARGKYLAFLDADDQWHSEKLAEHLKAHTDDPGLDASFAEVAFCVQRSGELVSSRSASSVTARDYELSDVIAENVVCTTSNLVIGREVFWLVGGFDEDLRYAEDQEFLARLVDAGHRLGGIAQPLVHYRMSDDGLSCDFDAMLVAWQAFADTWLGEEELAKAEALYCRYLARRALRSGASVSVARSFARRGLAADRKSFVGSDRLRGFLTLSGVVACGAMPVAVRRAVFA